MSDRDDLNKTQRLSDTEQEKLVAYLDGELDDASERQVVAEIGRRPELRQEAESLKKTWDLLDFLPKPAPPPQFTERTMHKLQATKLLLIRREQWWKRIAVAGWIFTLGLVALLAFAVVYYWPTRQALAETRPESTSSSADPKRLDPPPESLPENERFMHMVRQETNRMMAELGPKLEPYEKAELGRKRRIGGLVFMEELLSLAKKYNVPLQRPPGTLPPEAGGRPLRPGPEEEMGPGGKKKNPQKAGDRPTPSASASKPGGKTE